MNEMELRFFAPTPTQRELLILVEIERDPEVSQKELAKRVGLAPSMVNNYMKQLCDQEKIQKTGPNHKRITYHLTESGRRMRDELLSQYLMEGRRLCSSLREDLRRRLRQIQQDGISRVMLFGDADSCAAIGRAAQDVGLHVVQGADDSREVRTARVAIGGAVTAGGLEGAQAALVTDSRSEEQGSRLLRGFREKGLPVYHV